MPVEVTTPPPHRVAALAPVFGRAFVDEPMMRWPMGLGAGAVKTLTRCFSYLLEDVSRLGVVREAGDGQGAAVWVPPERTEAWETEARAWNQPRIGALADDGGRRYEAFWDWIDSRRPDEPLWQLDSIAVVPEAQGRGLGRALIEAGLREAEASGASAFLSTGTPRNVTIYGNLGFRLAEDLDAPGGGPHIWFMRWDP